MVVSAEKKKQGSKPRHFNKQRTRLKYTATTYDKMVFEAALGHTLRVPKYGLEHFHEQKCRKPRQLSRKFLQVLRFRPMFATF